MQIDTIHTRIITHCVSKRAAKIKTCWYDCTDNKFECFDDLEQELANNSSTVDIRCKSTINLIMEIIE